MKSILEEMWYDNISPQSDSRKEIPEMKELMGYIVRHQENLMETMTDEQREIFEKYEDCWSEYAGLSEGAIFVYAFRLGARIAIEVLSPSFNA